MRNLIFSLVGLILLSISCTDEMASEKEVTEILLDKLLMTEEINAIAKSGSPIAILKREYCENNDCKAIFQTESKGVKMYSVEDAFMHGLFTFIEVKEVRVSDNKSYMDVVISHEGKKINKKISL